LTCVVCGKNEWRGIPDPAADRSITTAGIIIDRGLAKSQCMGCGLIARTGEEFVGRSNYYEARYADYYRRPGAPVYEARRYRVMATWLKDAIPDLNPRTILDVGCGAGWSMTAVKKDFPDALIEGIEPSTANSELAKASGFKVHTFKVGTGSAPGSTYDLIYSNNVLTHVLDPVAFLSGLKDMLDSDGRIAIVTVDSTVPSNELLWCDNNYSYLPMHVVRLAEAAGLTPLHFEENPDDITILNKQLMVLGKRGRGDATIDAVRSRATVLGDLHQQRCEYMDSWRKTNDSLAESIRPYTRVINFGASMWSWLLAGFCPDYWNKVDFCTVDDYGGNCVDRTVVPFGEIEFRSGDCVALGVNPQTQDAFKARFKTAPPDVVTWNRFVTR
jgi:SAM-dependent methyltransferase